MDNIKIAIREQLHQLNIKLYEDAAEDAKKRGLEYRGWGRWANHSGDIVAKSVDGKLMDITPTKDPSKQNKVSKFVDKAKHIGRNIKGTFDDATNHENYQRAAIKFAEMSDEEFKELTQKAIKKVAAGFWGPVKTVAFNKYLDNIDRHLKKFSGNDPRVAHAQKSIEKMRNDVNKAHTSIENDRTKRK